MPRLDKNILPKKCWVGEQEKVCYGDRVEAEMASRLVEREHGLKNGALSVYKCEYGEHWHLSRNS
jgi:hypothetical protein